MGGKSSRQQCMCECKSMWRKATAHSTLVAAWQAVRQSCRLAHTHTHMQARQCMQALRAHGAEMPHFRLEAAGLNIPPTEVVLVAWVARVRGPAVGAVLEEGGADGTNGWVDVAWSGACQQVFGRQQWGHRRQHACLVFAVGDAQTPPAHPCPATKPCQQVW